MRDTIESQTTKGEFIMLLNYVLITIIAIVVIYFYLKNLAKAVIGFRNQEFSVLLVLRIIGVFIPVLGAVMGVV